MALQSSGKIEMSEIAAELGESLSNVSLGSMSDDAGFGAPDQMSDFYGYSHSSSTAYDSSPRANTSNLACAQTVNLTYYHNNASGNGTSYPSLNDYVYSDSGLSNKLSGGYYKIENGPYDTIRVNGFGRVFTTGICF